MKFPRTSKIRGNDLKVSKTPGGKLEDFENSYTKIIFFRKSFKNFDFDQKSQNP